MSRINQTFTREGILEHYSRKKMNRQSTYYRETTEFFQAVYDELTLNQQSTIPKRKELIMELKVEARRGAFRIIVRGQRRIATDKDGKALDKGGYETEKKAVSAAKRMVKKVKGFTFTPTTKPKAKPTFAKRLAAAGK